MPFRRISSTGIGAAPPPYFPRWCWEPACCSGNTTWVRTKQTTKNGGVKTCGINIQSYDPTADPGRYTTLNATWTRTWKRYSNDAVVRSCDMTFTASVDGPSYVRLVGESCEVSDEYSECDAPEICAEGGGCYYVDTPLVYTGSGEVSAADLAVGARVRQTISGGTWGSFAKGYANTIGGGHQARDTRGPGSASFTEIEWEIEIRGMVREHKITWIETIQPLPSGTPSTEERSLHITGPGVYSLVLAADPNTSRTMGNLMLQFAIP